MKHFPATGTNHKQLENMSMTQAKLWLMGSEHSFRIPVDQEFDAQEIGWEADCFVCVSPIA